MTTIDESLESAEQRWHREWCDERRERIATAALQGLYASGFDGIHTIVDIAVQTADQMILKLDGKTP